MSRQNSRTTIFGAILVVMVSLIVIVSFLPLGGKQALHTQGRLHPLGHLLAFASIGFVAMMTPKTFRNRILVVLGLLLLVLGIELGEHLIFQSAMEWPDVLTDCAGLFSGLLLALLPRPLAGLSERV